MTQFYEVLLPRALLVRIFLKLFLLISVCLHCPSKEELRVCGRVRVGIRVWVRILYSLDLLGTSDSRVLSFSGNLLLSWLQWHHVLLTFFRRHTPSLCILCWLLPSFSASPYWVSPVLSAGLSALLYHDIDVSFIPGFASCTCWWLSNYISCTDSFTGLQTINLHYKCNIFKYLQILFPCGEYHNFSHSLSRQGLAWDQKEFLYVSV